MRRSGGGEGQMTMLDEVSARALLPAGAPRLGLGCGDLYAGAEEAASLRLLKTAYDHGVRWFDVARLYGNGSAETVVGRAFQGLRDQVVIVSKAGILPWSMQTATRIRRKALTTAGRLAPFARRLLPEPPPAKERHGVFGAAEVARSVEASLRALRTDYLDILLLHECELPDAARPETLSLLEKLRADGKVRAFGIATRFPQTQAILSASPERFAVAQFPSDVFSQNERRLPSDWRGLVVTHSIYKGGLTRLRNEVLADPARAEAWTRRFGRPADEAAAYADLLLKDALASHDGVVLFTTSKPERIEGMVRAAQHQDPAEAAAFRDFLQTTGLRAAA
jgi:aryl-alcohol dehydrogenase-like predicted oxidoreductase